MHFDLATVVTILISAAFRGAELIRGRHLFQCGYLKVQRLFEAWRLLEGMWYCILFQNINSKKLFQLLFIIQSLNLFKSKLV